ncbi:MAG TPA: response regulator transcription factor [Ktedonobacteraceae bacterium]|jgi:DNA-binding NarL/FixJ family response regulator|nr:response regulator transcription factor [Ktedonobacteraceae bacterium]
MDPLTVIIADDHQLFRAGIRMILDAQPDMECVGEAATGDEAVRLVAEVHPEVVLMDLDMPGMSGEEATRRIVSCSPQTHVLVVTMFKADERVFEAMRAGARGYIVKEARFETLVRAIRTVGSGEAIFSPEIAAKLVDYFTALPAGRPSQVFPELTRSEREILTLLKQGYKNAEIAERLSLSQKTVRNYVSNIMSKLQVADRTQAILRARDAGFEA